MCGATNKIKFYQTSVDSAFGIIVKIGGGGYDDLV